MRRHLLVVLTGVGSALLIPARSVESAPPSGTEVAAIRAATVVKQAALARDFREAEQAFLRIAQRYERSSDAAQREKAVPIRKALALAVEQGMDNRFERLLILMQKSPPLTLHDLHDACGQSELLTRHLRAMLAILLGELPEEPPPPPPPDPGEPGDDGEQPVPRVPGPREKDKDKRAPIPVPRPQKPDIIGGEDPGDGSVDERELKQIAEQWGKLPARERARVMHGLTRTMPSRYRDVIELYFKKLADSPPPP
jgi:hypothetical protein